MSDRRQRMGRIWSVLGTLTSLGSAWGGVSWELFPAGEGFYNYAPCAIEDGRTHHFWWCQNTDPFRVADHIYYRRFEFDENRWTPRELALAPGAAGEWDCIHVCDPAVVRGEFSYRGQVYAYAMFYLGTDDRTGKHNQIGLAIAREPSGPWLKIEANPIIKGSQNTWGVGQPSVISLDKRSRLILFYTKQEENLATFTYWTELDLRNLDAPVIGESSRVPTEGLSERPGTSQVILNNADFALAPTGETLYVVRPQHPNEFLPPDKNPGISSHLQIARIPAADLSAGRGRWEVVTHIGPEQTGFAHNHNAAIARDPYGRLPDPHRMRINLTVAARQPDPLWSYTLHGLILELP